MNWADYALDLEERLDAANRGRQALATELAALKARRCDGCSATHPDTECEGWIWYCSLIAGHLGPHHCAGAAW